MRARLRAALLEKLLGKGQARQDPAIHAEALSEVSVCAAHFRPAPPRARFALRRVLCWHRLVRASAWQDLTGQATGGGSPPYICIYTYTRGHRQVNRLLALPRLMEQDLTGAERRLDLLKVSELMSERRGAVACAPPAGLTLTAPNESPRRHPPPAQHPPAVRTRAARALPGLTPTPFPPAHRHSRCKPSTQAARECLP